jgi:hypothetical protein
MAHKKCGGTFVRVLLLAGAGTLEVAGLPADDVVTTGPRRVRVKKTPTCTRSLHPSSS